MSLMTTEKLQAILEAALMVAGHPLTIAALQNLFDENERPDNDDIKTALQAISERHQQSGIELHEVSSGYRLQAKPELSPWLAKLWEDRPARYSRAFLETLAIIAYKQPITRAEIEQIRGVTVSTNIMKILSDREWVRLVGFRDTPGKPALYGTTKTFLDHFSLTSLSGLPTLAEFKDMQTQDAELQVQLAIENSNIGPDNSEVIPEEREALLLEESTTAAYERTEETSPEAIEELVEISESYDSEVSIELEATEELEAIEQLEETEELEEIASYALATEESTTDDLNQQEDMPEESEEIYHSEQADQDDTDQTLAES
jgi:segregation and condensation protein B